MSLYLPALTAGNGESIKETFYECKEKFLK
jgi:hypothetical protein